jgi:hypothetical protein
MALISNAEVVQGWSHVPLVSQEAASGVRLDTKCS